MPESTLDQVVFEVREKAVGVKPNGTRYVGLDHIEPGSSRLVGTAPSSFSVGTNGVFQPGDVLFGKLRPNLRKSIQVHFSGYCSTDLLVLRPRVGIADRFAAHLLGSDSVFSYAEMNSIGTKMPRTSWAALRRAPITLPRIEEQRRIAEILDTIDEAIRTSEGLIAKLQLVERGLAADALGEAIANSHWCVALGSALVGRGSLIQTGPFGSQLHAHEYVPNGIPAFMPQDIRPPNLNIEGASKVTPFKASTLARHALEEGDLLLARRGDLSKCAVVRDGAVGGLCGTGCLLVRPGGSGLNSDWLALCYQSDFVQRQVAARAVGSTMANVSAGLVRDLVVPCPPEDWQSDVVDRLSAARATIECERDVLAKLVKQRHGLAADLLSGRVRTVGS